MLLAIDVGNTRVKMALPQGAGLTLTCTKLRAKADASFAFARLGNEDIRAVGSSVVPDIKKMIDAAFVQLHGKEIVWIDATMPLGVPILYKTPGQLGADRLANVIAATTLYQVPLVVVDFGTATKLDVVNQAGAYLGGAIMPGVQMGLAALDQSAAQLKKLKPEWPKFDIGQDTTESILAGAVLGHAFAVAGLIHQYQRLLGTPLSVVLTGGDARIFLGRPSSPLKEFNCLHNANLTTAGLFEAAKRLGIA